MGRSECTSLGGVMDATGSMDTVGVGVFCTSGLPPPQPRNTPKQKNQRAPNFIVKRTYQFPRRESTISAARKAMAMMVICGLTPSDDGIALPSQTKRFATSCAS